METKGCDDGGSAEEKGSLEPVTSVTQSRGRVQQPGPEDGGPASLACLPKTFPSDSPFLSNIHTHIHWNCSYLREPNFLENSRSFPAPRVRQADRKALEIIILFCKSMSMLCIYPVPSVPCVLCCNSRSTRTLAAATRQARLMPIWRFRYHWYVQSAALNSQLAMPCLCYGFGPDNFDLIKSVFR